MADNVQLEHRDGLPDALRVLLETHPKSGWEGAVGFDGLIRFWLDRHLMFRSLLSSLQQDAEARLDRKIEDRSYRTRLSRLGGHFLNDLHMHHGIEDHHFFPILSQRDTRLARGFEILDADHHALDAWLNGFETAANAALLADGDAAGREAVAPLHAELGRMARLLNRHLTDEEELIVPVILEYGTDGLPG